MVYIFQYLIILIWTLLSEPLYNIFIFPELTYNRNKFCIHSFFYKSMTANARKSEFYEINFSTNTSYLSCFK